jgi:DNA repair protein RecN (Recombination protein N)
MADKMQVIAITHLPQIAVKAQRHFYVYKVTENKNTYTAIKHLDDNERITEIAKMLSGDKVSDAAMKNALELLKLQAN